MTAVEVSAGLITRADGALLVCQRAEGRKNALLWEFPGGKREAGESAEACLTRELMEELRLAVSPPRRVCEATAQGIRFTFLLCRALNEPQRLEHRAIAFLPPRKLLGLPFCPADADIARALALNHPPLRHFFWDFDGTLMDTYPMMTQTVRHACRVLGAEPDAAEVLGLMKNTLAFALDTLSARYGLDRAALERVYRAERQKEDVLAVPPVAGIPEAMAALRALGGRHYLVTHRDKTALDMLRNVGLLDEMTDAVTSEDGFARKPAPDSCLHLLKKHGIDPCAAVMIGDRPLDVAAGLRAGMLGCLLDTEDRFPPETAPLRAKCAAALPSLLCPAFPPLEGGEHP